MLKRSQHEMDMTQGPLLPQVLRFTIPLMLSGMLQLLYNAADVVVVGRFASSQALAAVSSTGAMINLITTVFMGLSLGASVLVARAYGAGDLRDISDSVHTSMAMAVVCGVIVTILGFVLGRPMLEWMNTPEDVMDLAAVYVKIYFSGTIFNMIYNYGAAVMRAVGDTRRPMYYLILSGAVNVVFNMIFVIVFHMGVVGVALATVISQLLAAALVVISLMRSHTSIRLDLRKLRINPQKILPQIKIGLPAGIQGAMFAISNMILQSAVNSFGSAAMAGNGAGGNIEGFIYVATNSFYTACLTFTSQNVGAKKADRIGKIMRTCLFCEMTAGLSLGILMMVFGRPLLGIYSSDPLVISMGLERIYATGIPYFLLGMSEVYVGGLRGMGSSFGPMIISVLGICVLRLAWVAFIFPLSPSIFTLYISYPVSWGFTALAQGIYYIIVKRKMVARIQAELQQA